MPIRCLLQGIMITGIYTRGLFAMAADSSECRIFTKGGNAIVLRMIKIIASHLAFLALATNL